MPVTLIVRRVANVEAVVIITLVTGDFSLLTLLFFTFIIAPLLQTCE